MKVCEFGGCMSKISGEQLKQMFWSANITSKKMGEIDIPNIEIEDCAIIPEIDSDILFTTDFGPLVGTDCQSAGRIAVLNALSDVYAMGGNPIYAEVILIVGNDVTIEERDMLFSSIVRTCREENVQISGGHSIEGSQTIIGMSVIGCTGKKVFKKRNCSTGDVLLISKPLGTGLSLRGYYNGFLNDEQYAQAINIMLKSNKIENKLLNSPYIHSITDVTGYGLLGHLSEMLNENQGTDIYISQVPFLDAILDLPHIALSNKYIENNFLYAQEGHIIKWHLDSICKMALCDPQTNGPLLISAGKEILPFIKEYGLYFIGEITNGMEVKIVE